MIVKTPLSALHHAAQQFPHIRDQGPSTLQLGQTHPCDRFLFLSNLQGHRKGLDLCKIHSLYFTCKFVISVDTISACKNNSSGLVIENFLSGNKTTWNPSLFIIPCNLSVMFSFSRFGSRLMEGEQNQCEELQISHLDRSNRSYIILYKLQISRMIGHNSQNPPK